METPLFQQLWSRSGWPAEVHRSFLTPLAFLERALHVYPEATAVVDGERRLTYRELGARVYRLASALREAGVRKGDRVAVLVPNSLEALEAHFGVPQLGAVLVMINVRLTSHEIGAILRHSGARVLIAHPELAPVVDPLRTEIDFARVIWTAAEVPEAHPSTQTYEALLASGQPGPFAPAIDGEDQVICLNYTSGTTGHPKGVMYTHRGAYLNALGEVIEHGLRPSSVYLWTLPMFHCNGWC